MQDITIPKGEIWWVNYRNMRERTVFALTSKPDRTFYTLYEVSPDGKMKRLGKAKSPKELEERFGVNEIMLKK